MIIGRGLFVVLILGAAGADGAIPPLLLNAALNRGDRGYSARERTSRCLS